MTRSRSILALLGWLGALATGLAVFHGMGAGTLPAPPIRPAALLDWVGTTDPAIATMSLLRLFVLATTWYLVGATGLGVLARLLGAVHVVRFADALTFPAVRRLVQSTLGVGLATSMVMAATPARAQPLPLQLLEQTAADEGEPADAASTAAEGVPAPEVAPPVVQPPVVAPADEVQAAEHTVVTGESFWRIAADRVASGTDGRADDAEVAVYWRRLIEQNRSRLADPDNPDLLFPGQRLVLPPIRD